jgi:hypothetical protein
MDTDDGFTKDDPLRNLEPFEGVKGLTYTPQNPSSISEAVDHYCGDQFFKIFAEQSNLYHNQNLDKHKTSSKTLKWVHISTDEMKRFLVIIILM